MTDPLAEIVSLVPPPKSLVSANGDWAQIENELGLVFPSDYKRFVTTFGSGNLCKLFEIVSPFELVHPARIFWTNWAEFFKAMEEHGEQIPYPVYPEIPGLLPCAVFATSNVLSWYTLGDPDEWKLKYYDRDRGFFSVESGLVEFLAAVLRGQSPLPQEVLSSEDIPRPYVFEQT